jgi:glycosidase
MAANTPKDYRRLVIYEIYVRNHSSAGTFKGVEDDLERIRALGVDVVWFMPLHPIGQLNKKGSLGCPYSIADYEEVNPAYGSKADFKRCIDKAHALGMKVMIDVVYNHTAHDSKLVRLHPEWFHQGPDGKPVTTVPDWTDVIDLNHPQEGLETYLVEVLKEWVRLGVDGFRCDVASLVPVHLWKRARAETAAINPDMVWLAESVYLSFVEERRQRGLYAQSDSELYEAFDMTYDYDIWAIWQAVVKGEALVKEYLQMLRFQSGLYPANFVKLRCVENHDQSRIMHFAPSRQQALAWTAFSAFLPGAFLIYGGQESEETKLPSLFEHDKVEWKDYALTPFIKKLSGLKKHTCLVEGKFDISGDDPCIQAVWQTGQQALYGIFNVLNHCNALPVRLPDGAYRDYLSGEIVQVHNGQVTAPKSAWILETAPLQNVPLMQSNLIDYHVS